MRVFVTGSGKCFHRDAECRRIRCGQRAKGSSGVHEVELEELVNISPCLTCFPDAPRATTWHRFCHTCSTSQPCEHNGGVLVEVERTWHSGSSLLLSAGEKTVATRYVWPEKAHRYRLVSSAR